MKRLFALAFLFSVVPVRAADDRYFLLVFGSERTSRGVDHAHSFASFVKRCETPTGAALEVRTISWLPARLPVRTFKIRPETGHNYELNETIRFLQADGQRVSVWGPFEIRPELYELAGERIRELESGRLKYKSNDGLFRDTRVVNCIHALTGLAERDRIHLLPPGWGDVASHRIAEQLSPWMRDRCATHDSVAREMGLEQFCLAYRKLSEKPRHLGGANPPLTAGPPASRGRFRR